MGDGGYFLNFLLGNHVLVNGMEMCKKNLKYALLNWKYHHQYVEQLFLNVRT